MENLRQKQDRDTRNVVIPESPVTYYVGQSAPPLPPLSPCLCVPRLRTRCTASPSLAVVVLAGIMATALAPRSGQSQEDKSPANPQAGELGLRGCIVEIDLAKSSFILKASAFVVQGGRSQDISPSKAKRILLLPDTRIRRDGQPESLLRPSELSVGQTVQVVGKDAGAGQPLPARLIILIGQDQPETTQAAKTGEEKNIAAMPIAQSADRPILVPQIGHSNLVTSVCFSPDGREVLSGSWDGTVVVWDTETGQIERRLQGLEGRVSSLSVSPDGKWLAIGTSAEVSIWSVASGQLEKSLLKSKDGVCAVSFHPSGRQLASGSPDGTITLWNVATGKPERTLKGHEGAVFSVCYSRDGRKLASGSGKWDEQQRHYTNGQIVVWDVGNGQAEKTITGQKSSISCVVFSPDGSKLASSSGADDRAMGVWQTGSAEVLLWNVASGQAEKTLSGHQSPVGSLSFSPDGKELAGAAFGHTVVWDVESGQVATTFNGMGLSGVVSFSPDGKTLACGSGFYNQPGGVMLFSMGSVKHDRRLKAPTSPDFRFPCSLSGDGSKLAWNDIDGKLNIWDLETGQPVKTLRAEGGWSLSPDGRRLSTGTADGRIVVWDLSTGEVERTLKGHRYRVGPVSFSSDGRKLVSGSQTNDPQRQWQPVGEIILWDVQTWQAEKTLRGQQTVVSSLSFSPDGRKLVSGARDSIVVWDVQSGQVEKTLKGDGIRVVFSPDGRRLASGMFGSITVWNLESGQAEKTLEGPIYSFCFSPDGKSFVSQSLMVPGIAIHDIASWQVKKVLPLPSYVFSLSRDGAKLAVTLGSSGTVVIADVVSGKTEVNLGRHTSPVVWISFSPNGDKLISASGDVSGKEPVKHGETIVWDLKSRRDNKVFRGHSDQAGNVVLSPDEKQLASARCYGNTVAIWDMAKTRIEKVLQADDNLYDLAFSPDGRQLTGALRDKRIVIWNIERGQSFKTLKRHTAEVSSVCFSPDGRKVASGGYDKTVVIWDAETLQAEKVLTGHTDKVFAVCFSPDGRKLASSSGDKTVVLWDVETGKVERTFTGHTDQVYFVSFSPDGRTLASGQGHVPLVILWDTRTGQLVKKLPGPWRVLSFTADGKRLLATSGEEVTLWNLENQRIEKNWKGASAAWCLTQSPSSNRMMFVSQDGNLKLWDPVGGKELASLFTLDDGQDWLVTTPEGYYDASPNGAKFVSWRLGNQLYPAERFEEQFKRPDLVAKALRGESLPTTAPVLTLAQIPPAAQFLAPRDGTSVEGNSVQVEVLGTDDKEVTELVLFVNGRPLSPGTKRSIEKRIAVVERMPENHKVSHTFKATVPLPPGEETVRLSAVVYDDERLKSNMAEVTIRRRLSTIQLAQAEGDLYALCIGVSRYKNLPADSQLQFANADARDLGDSLKGQQGGLYRQVVVRVLTDSEATASAIRAALFELIEKAKPKDTVVLLFSGHGLRDDDFNYYFVPYELDLKDIKGTGVPTGAFESVLSKVEAKQVFAFFDTCHSGGVLGERRIGTERLAEALMKKAGVQVFCSSKGEELSFERPEWKHGAFTLALLEGLSGQADLIKDGVITVSELQTFVADRVAKLTEGRQNPCIPLQIGANPNAKLAKVQ